MRTSLTVRRKLEQLFARVEELEGRVAALEQAGVVVEWEPDPSDGRE